MASHAVSLVLEDVVYRYPRSHTNAIDRLDAQLASRSIAVLGVNGAGKSTLFALLSTTRRAQSGSLALGGWDRLGQNSARGYRKALGVVPQSLTLPGGLTAGEFVRYVAWLREVPASQVDERIEAALATVDLGARRDEPVKRLSGGERQRLRLAQALVNRPDVLLLDEPTVGLDPAQRKIFLDHLARISDECIVVLATHLPEDVAAFASDVLMIDAGRALFAGSVSEFCGAAEVTSEAVERAFIDRLGRR